MTKNKNFRTFIYGLLTVATISLSLTACSSDADVVSENLSKDADNFKVLRRVTLYNGITDKYIVTVEGFCSLGNHDTADKVSVTCKVPGAEPNGYIKNIYTRSDNTTIITEQLDARNVSKSHYKVIFKPSEVIPDIDVR